MRKTFLSIIMLHCLLICKAQVPDTLECDHPGIDSVEFENLPWVGNNQYLENFLDSIGYPSKRLPCWLRQRMVAALHPAPIILSVANVPE